MEEVDDGGWQAPNTVVFLKRAGSSWLKFVSSCTCTFSRSFAREVATYIAFVVAYRYAWSHPSQSGIRPNHSYLHHTVIYKITPAITDS